MLRLNLLGRSLLELLLRESLGLDLSSARWRRLLACSLSLGWTTLRRSFLILITVGIRSIGILSRCLRSANGIGDLGRSGFVLCLSLGLSRSGPLALALPGSSLLQRLSREDFVLPDVVGDVLNLLVTLSRRIGGNARDPIVSSRRTAAEELVYLNQLLASLRCQLKYLVGVAWGISTYAQRCHHLIDFGREGVFLDDLGIWGKKTIS